VRAKFKSQREGVAAHQFVDAIGSYGVVELAGAVVADRVEEGAFGDAPSKSPRYLMNKCLIGSRCAPGKQERERGRCANLFHIC
jgi:hypothetical protein